MAAAGKEFLMPSPFTPGETALVDQALAAADEDLDDLLAAVRERIASHGREAVLADLAVMLHEVLLPGQRSRAASLLLAAVLRLARQEQETGQ
jgi:hypothetical protein